MDTSLTAEWATLIQLSIFNMIIQICIMYDNLNVVHLQ